MPAIGCELLLERAAMELPRTLPSWSALFWCLLVLVTAGCGSKYPPTAPVKGKITLNGKPVTTGRISFHPTTGERPALANIQPDGSYSLTTFERGDGALLGRHKVSIKSTRIENAPPTPKDLKEEAEFNAKGLFSGKPRLVFLVDKKYYDDRTTDLEAEVKREGNQIDFHLPTSAAPLP
jgi:hypothetical protein